MKATIVGNVHAWLLKHGIVGIEPIALADNEIQPDRVRVYDTQGKLLTYALANNWHMGSAKNHDTGTLANDVILSLREPNTYPYPSMQICIHRLNHGLLDNLNGKPVWDYRIYLEIDFDMDSPNDGCRGFIGHAGEFVVNAVTGRTTDQEKVAAGLKARGIELPDVFA